MSTAAQRKAWNEAMRSAGAVLPSSSSARTASSAAIDRRRKRRDGARKSSSVLHGDGAAGSGGGASSVEEREYRVALRMDTLEGVVGDGTTITLDADDDEYDEFAELEDDDDDDDDAGERESKGKSKKKRKRKGGTGGGGGGTGKNSSSSAMPKYLKPRSLASILMEEAGRFDSVAFQYVNASVRRLGSGQTVTRSVDSVNNAVVTTTTNPYPPRKFCPVTGLFGAYTEPKSGIPYATLSALEQIRERPPPWMNAGNNSGSASYWEAVKTLQNN